MPWPTYHSQEYWSSKSNPFSVLKKVNHRYESISYMDIIKALHHNLQEK